jgi:hypothetical protein
VDSFGTDAPNGREAQERCNHREMSASSFGSRPRRRVESQEGIAARVALGGRGDGGKTGKRSIREGVKRKPGADEPIVPLPHRSIKNPGANDDSMWDGQRR